MDVAKSDWKYMKVKADPNFNPDKNKSVINEVIKETNALTRKKKRKFNSDIGERAEVLATYIDSGEGDMSTYFGKKYYDYLRGKKSNQEIMSKDGLTVVDSKGKVIRRPYEVK